MRNLLCPVVTVKISEDAEVTKSGNAPYQLSATNEPRAFAGCLRMT